MILAILWKAFFTRCQKPLEDMTHTEEVQCLQRLRHPYYHKNCLDELRQMGRYSNVGGGFDGRSTRSAGCTTDILIINCDVVSNVRSNGQVFRCVSLECQGCG